MEELKLRFTNIEPLEMKCNNALFTAFYENNKVVIKCLKPQLMSYFDQVTQKQVDWIDGMVPNEIAVYEYMQSLQEIQQYIPKFYLGITEENTKNFDNKWLCEEYLGKNDIHGIHGYLVIEYIEGKTFDEFEKNNHPIYNKNSFPKIIDPILDIFESHGIMCCDLHSGNVIVKSSGSIYFIDFEVAEIW